MRADGSARSPKPTGGYPGLGGPNRSGDRQLANFGSHDDTFPSAQSNAFGPSSASRNRFLMWAPSRSRIDIG